MKNKLIRKYSLLKTIRDRKNIYFILILIISVVVLLGTLTFRVFYAKLLNNSFNKDITYRRLLVRPDFKVYGNHGSNYDYGFDRILSINHVTDLYNIEYDVKDLETSFKNEKYDGTVELLYGNNRDLPKNVIGKTITENDTGVAICAKNFYPSFKEPDWKDKNAFMDGKKLIGTSFKVYDNVYQRIDGKLISDYTYEKEFKIVGVFDTSESGERLYTCYVSGRDMKEMYIDTNKQVLNEGAFTPELVTVDNYKNLSKVANEISKLNYVVSTQVYFDDSPELSINLICAFLLIITVVAVSLLVMLYIKKKCLNSSYDIGILKAIGYNQKEIKQFYLWQILFIVFISFIIGSILFLGIIAFIKTFFYTYITYNNYVINIYLSTFIIALSLLIIIPIIINNIFIGKALKSDTIVLLKKEKQ